MSCAYCAPKSTTRTGPAAITLPLYIGSLLGHYNTSIVRRQVDIEIRTCHGSHRCRLKRSSTAITRIFQIVRLFSTRRAISSQTARDNDGENACIRWYFNVSRLYSLIFHFHKSPEQSPKFANYAHRFAHTVSKTAKRSAYSRNIISDRARRPACRTAPKPVPNGINKSHIYVQEYRSTHD